MNTPRRRPPNTVAELPANLDTGLVDIYKGSRDSKEDFLDTVTLSKKIVKTSIKMLSNSVDKLANHFKKLEDNDSVDIELELASVEHINNLAATLSKLNDQYFMLNYVPTGKISISELIRKGSTSNEAGNTIDNLSNLNDRDSKAIEVSPDDIADDTEF